MPKPPLHVFWDGDSVYVVAHDSSDAEHVYNEYVGDVDSFTSLEFSRFPDDHKISILVWTKGDDAGKIAPADQAGSDETESLTQTARLWADQVGRGFLCTTDF